MKQQDILNLLTTTPNAASIESAKQWLTQKKKSTKSTQEVAEAMLRISRDKEMLEWFSRWLVDKRWHLPLWAAANFESPEIHDWLVEFASANATNPEAGKLWAELLNRYKDAEVIAGGKEWLLLYGSGTEAIRIVITILEYGHDTQILEKAKELAKVFPNDVSLAKALIEHIGDNASIEFGRKIMNTQDSIMGAFIAESLLRRDSTQHHPMIEAWFREHWNDKHAKFILSELFQAAPEAMSDITFAWLDDHPNADNLSLIFQSIFILSPSQDLLNKTWAWIKKHLNKRSLPAMLNIVLVTCDGLQTPKDAVELAEEWLSENMAHKDAQAILRSLLSIDGSTKHIELARRWLEIHTFEESGSIFLCLLRITDSEEFDEPANRWRTENSSDPKSWAIFREFLKRNPSKERIQEAKMLLRAGDSQARQYLGEALLCDLVKLGDFESIEKAKLLLNRRRLDRRWSMSPDYCNGTILLALLEGAPGNQHVIDRTTEWLSSYDQDAASLVDDVRKAYQKSLSSQC